MEKLTDYIRWIGDLDFRVFPFRDADAVILANISYFDLSPVFSDGKTDHTVADCLPMIEAGEAKLMITGGDLGNHDLFASAARSARFGSLRISDYEDVLRTDPPLQFSAVTFHAPDFSVIAYRGTDASIAGWREDCMISFTRTEAQELSLKYAERVINEGEWYITGHSKGANQAQYAACMLPDEQWEKVKHVWLLDGPGFCPEVMDPRLDQRIDAKTTRIIPEYDVVGMLFEPKITDTKIVYSSLSGITQHALCSWMVDCGSLAAAEKNSPGSMRLNRLMNDWIESIPQSDRTVFINELFDVLCADGSESLEELDMDRLQSVLIRLTGISPTTRKALAKLPNRLFFDDAIPELPQTKTEKLKRIFSDLRVQGVGLIAAGVILFFLSGVLFELTTVIILTALAGVQTVLLVRRLIRQHGKLDGMRGRFVLLGVILALAASLFFKEHAVFLIGSVLYGILSLALAFYTVVKKGLKREKKSFLRVLNFIEGAVSTLFGLGYLVIPQSIVWKFTIAFAVCGALDGLLRLGCWTVKYLIRRSKEKAIANETLHYGAADNKQEEVS